jgi:hypothetical protein
MEAIRMQKAVEKDGEIFLTGLPYKKGQFVEMILLSDNSTALNLSRLTARQLLQSELIGLWEDRDDIEDSSAYARQLCEEA